MNTEIRSIKKMQIILLNFNTGSIFKNIVLYLCLFIVTYNANAANLKDTPDLQKMVFDKVGVLQADQLDTLERRLELYEEATSNRIIILIEKNIQGNTLPDYTMNQFKSLGMGDKKKSNDVLLVIDFENKKSFLATGEGLKDVLPDEQSLQITNDIVHPSFKQEQYYDGINDALKAITGSINGTYKFKPKLKPGFSYKSLIVPLVIFFLLIASTVYFNLRSERRVRISMHTYNISNEEARILLGLDRPSEIGGGGWEAFKGGGATGGWA